KHRSSELLSEAVHGDAGTKSDRSEWQFSSGVGAHQPYAYSLFNLEAMTAVCQIVSTRADNLWAFETSDGRGIRKVVECICFPSSPTREVGSWLPMCSISINGLCGNRAWSLLAWLSRGRSTSSCGSVSMLTLGQKKSSAISQFASPCSGRYD